MRRFSLAISITAVAIAAVGCGRSPDADRPATRVLRPEEVKITLGPEAPAKPAAEAPQAAPAGDSAKTP